MIRKLSLLLLGLVATVNAGAATFNLYSPAAGIQKNTGSTYVNTAAASADVIGLWSGTCNAASFLRGDGSCVAAGTPPGGSDGQVQFNNAGAFGGDSGLTFNSGTDALSVAGSVIVAGTSVRDAAILTSGTLPVARGGTNLTSATDDAALVGNGTTWLATAIPNCGSSTQALAYSTSANTFGCQTVGPAGAALTRVDDTNVTLTLGGSPSTALVNAASITAGWTGQLAVSRGGTGAATLSGVLKGNGTSAIGAAASSDVIALWSGTCNSGTFLRGDGSCQAAGGGGTPGGSTTQVQFNNAGSFGGSSDFTWNSGLLTVTGDIDASGVVTGGNVSAATTMTVAGQNVCQANGTNCPASIALQSYGARKLSGTTRTNTTTTSADPDLTFSVVSGTYQVKVQFNTAVPGGGGLRWQFNCSGESNNVRQAMVYINNGGARSTQIDVDSASGDMLLAAATYFPGAGTYGVNIDASIKCSAGTLSFDWAQETSNGSGFVIGTGATMLATRVGT